MKQDGDYENLPKWVTPGASFNLTYSPKNLNNFKAHVRGVVDGRAVLRTWLRRKQRWHYFVEGPIWFEVNREYLTNKKGA